MPEQRDPKHQGHASTRRSTPHRSGPSSQVFVGSPAAHSNKPTPAGAPAEAQIREAWLRAEACCECLKESHGHAGRCDQFLIWTDRGGTGKGAWEVRVLQDPRRPPCLILCAACYAKSTGQG